MPFTVGWYDTGMLVDCTDTLDMQAMDRLLKIVGAALDRCGSPTNVILDWRGSQGTYAQRHECTRRVALLSHPNLGRVAAVDRDPIAHFRIDLMYDERDHLYLTCASLEEAVLLLRRRPSPIKRLRPARNAPEV